MNAPVLLAVEDNPDLAHLFQLLIEGIQGTQTLLTGSEEEAVELVHRCNPTLVLLSLELPPRGGLPLLRQLKADPHTAHVPVVVVSAVRQKETEAIAAGCAEFVEKPFDIDALVDAVCRHLPVQTY